MRDGALYLHSEKLALLTGCVGRIMSHDDLPIKVLKQNYGTCLDRERCAMPVQGVLTLWLGLGQVFP